MLFLFCFGWSSPSHAEEPVFKDRLPFALRSCYDFRRTPLRQTVELQRHILLFDIIKSMKFIAYTVKGLENIAKQEIESLVPNAVILESKVKRVVFTTSIELGTLLKLKTVDNVGFFLGTFQASETQQIVNYINDLDLVLVKETIGRLRKVTNEFSITLSLVGVKDINSEILRNSLSEQIRSKYGWQYTEQDHSNFDIRIFADRRDVTVSVRLTEKPLFHRGYRTTSVKGALRPTIAAAMVRLATQNRKGVVVDNFCGSGTILAEALLVGNRVYGGDIESEATRACKENLSNLGYDPRNKIRELDASQTKWNDNQFDYAISNLPWDKQIKAESVTKLYTGSMREYARIIRSDGAVCLLVSKPELLVKHAKNYFPTNNITQTNISFLGQSPCIVTIRGM